jgi:hypothetical protein
LNQVGFINTDSQAFGDAMASHVAQLRPEMVQELPQRIAVTAPRKVQQLP